jgi:anti-anti-sigma factor
MVAETAEMGAAVRIQQSSEQGCVVLALAGRLDLAAVPQVRRAIFKQLAEQPPAIICDLSRVEGVDPLCAAVFASIRHPALDWPGTVLLLCGARPAVADTLRRQGMAARLAIYASLDQALANLGTRPPWLRETLALEPVAAAARVGREFVREVCGRWGSSHWPTRRHCWPASWSPWRWGTPAAPWSFGWSCAGAGCR